MFEYLSNNSLGSHSKPASEIIVLANLLFITSCIDSILNKIFLFSCEGRDGNHPQKVDNALYSVAGKVNAFEASRPQYSAGCLPYGLQ